MSNPPPPQSLGALLARAEDFALFTLRSGGKVPPTLLALGWLRDFWHEAGASRSTWMAAGNNLPLRD